MLKTHDISVELLLLAYAKGFFPMAESRKSQDISWFTPEKRGILPLESFHTPRSLQKFLKTAPFTFTIDKSFPEVIHACAERKGDTWINGTIIDLYCRLHALGFAHSVEVWKKFPPPLRERELVGGLYGVSLGGAFFAESMFSRTSNASKAALVHLVRLLNEAGYSLLDCQYVNDHLKQFGVVEINRDEYLKKLERALLSPPNGGVWANPNQTPP